VALLLLSVLLLGLLKNLNSKVDSIEQKLSKQGEKISILYDVVNIELELESKKGYIDEKKKEKELDQKLALNVVNEFQNAQFTSKAKFHPHENLFAVCLGDGQVKIINAETRKETQTIHKSDEIITAIAFLPNGKDLILGTKSGKLYRSNFSDGQVVLVGEISHNEIARLDAGGNNRIAVGVGGSYEESKKNRFGIVFDLNTKAIISEYYASFREDFQGIAISQDGEIVVIDEVIGKARGACLFNATEGSELKLLYHQKYGSGPLSVDIALDNVTTAVGYAPDDVIVWNNKEGIVKWLFDGHSNWVVSLDFSKDGKYLASGAGDSTARIYNLQTGEEVGRVRFPGSSTYVKSVAISSDGRLLLAAVDSFVGIYKMPEEK